MWILTVAKVFSADMWGFGQEEAVQMNLLKESAWFRIPYPGKDQLWLDFDTQLGSNYSCPGEVRISINSLGHGLSICR